MQVSISLPRKMIDWLDEIGTGRSEIVQKALFVMMKERVLDNPLAIRRELTDIEEKIEEIHIRKSVLINKLSYHVENTEQKNLKEKEIILEQLKVEKKKQREVINFIKKIPKIDDILKKAFNDSTKFNYYEAIDKIRKTEEFRNVDILSLKLYVQSKNKKKKEVKI